MYDETKTWKKNCMMRGGIKKKKKKKKYLRAEHWWGLQYRKEGRLEVLQPGWVPGEVGG